MGVCPNSIPHTEEIRYIVCARHSMIYLAELIGLSIEIPLDEEAIAQKLILVKIDKIVATGLTKSWNK